MTYSPVGNKVLVQRVEEVNRTKSGIFLAANQQKEVAHAKVLGVGKGVDEKIGVKVGDIVAFDAMRGYTLQTPDGDFLLLLDHEILATAQEN